MTNETPPIKADAEQLAITREFLLEGTFLVDARQRFGDAVMSDDELDGSLRSFLENRPGHGPVWVFAYGSLMWNPAFLFDDQAVGIVSGWRRRFSIWIPYGRGSAERPNLMLALDKGGSAEGVLFKVPRGQELIELLLVWRREMFGRIYVPAWVDVEIGNRRVWAITFVADRSNAAYAGDLPDEIVARVISTASGFLGTAREYFDAMMRHLDGLDLKDEGMERLRGLLDTAATEAD